MISSDQFNDFNKLLTGVDNLEHKPSWSRQVSAANATTNYFVIEVVECVLNNICSCK